MEEQYIDICSCPECSYFDMDKAHCCGLPERIAEKDIPHIRGPCTLATVSTPSCGSSMRVWR